MTSVSDHSFDSTNRILLDKGILHKRKRSGSIENSVAVIIFGIVIKFKHV